MALQSKGGQKLRKKQITKCYKGQFLNTKKFLIYCFVVIKVQDDL
jgi:hypothetical protein